MAKLKKQVLGKISGALGDIVFREINGKNVVGIRPSNVNVSNDPEAIARRARFALSAKLAQAVNGHLKLKAIWMLKAPAGQSTHNFLIKTNYLNVNPAGLSDLVKLVPDAGFPVSASDSNVSSTGINVELNSIGVNNLINPAFEVNMQMLSVMFLNGAVDNSIPAFSLISASSEVQALSLTNPLQFHAALVGNDELLFDKYTNKKTFNVFITMDASGNVIHYSNTLFV